MPTIKSPFPVKFARSGPSRPVQAFNKEYYRRYYQDPLTRVRSASANERLAGFVFGYMHHLEIPVRRVLDLGCGLGQWKNQVATYYPRADYTGVEISPYLCEKFGWAESSVADFQGRGQYDLVLCQSVFQYLGDAEVDRALENIARLCRGALFLEIITKGDWDTHCDKKATDGNVHLREYAWYKKRLSRFFKGAGGGLFLPKDSSVVLYELEST